jgi:hypothetical protein
MRLFNYERQNWLRSLKPHVPFFDDDDRLVAEKGVQVVQKGVPSFVLPEGGDGGVDAGVLMVEITGIG